MEIGVNNWFHWCTSVCPFPWCLCQHLVILQIRNFDNWTNTHVSPSVNCPFSFSTYLPSGTPAFTVDLQDFLSIPAINPLPELFLTGLTSFLLLSPNPSPFSALFVLLEVLSFPVWVSQIPSYFVFCFIFRFTFHIWLLNPSGVILHIFSIYSLPSLSSFFNFFFKFESSCLTKGLNR